MSDADAREFEARRDQTEDWEPTVRRRTKPGRLDAVVSIRFSPDEERMLRERAAADGTTISAMIREAALRHVLHASVPFASVTRVVSYAAGGTILPDGRIVQSRPDPIPAGRIVEPV